jgi:hypothetical protein
MKDNAFQSHMSIRIVSKSKMLSHESFVIFTFTAVYCRLYRIYHQPGNQNRDHFPSSGLQREKFGISTRGSRLTKSHGISTKHEVKQKTIPDYRSRSNRSYRHLLLKSRSLSSLRGRSRPDLGSCSGHASSIHRRNGQFRCVPCTGACE